MPALFSLDAVLRLRQHSEDVEERSLAALVVQQQQVEATLERVREQMQQWTAARNAEKNHLGTGATQQGSYARLAVLRDAEKLLAEQREELKKRLTEQQTAYLLARRGRETLTKLKEQHMKAWETAKQRGEQRRLEDLFLGRWSR